MEEREFGEDPDPYFEEARQAHPWLARARSGYVVHELKAIKDLLILDNHMRTSFDGIVQLMGAKDTPWGRFTEEQMLAHSGASHKRLRDLLAPRFTPRQANEHRPLMRDVISQLLDEWAPKGKFDFEEFASYFPVSVLCGLVGAERSEVGPLRSSLEALGLGFSLDPDYLPNLHQAIGVLDEFVHRLVQRRREHPSRGQQPDLLDTLLEVGGEGGLTDRELHDMLIFLFVAGFDTSKNVLTYTMNLMIDHPELYQRCATDYEFCRKAIEESLRYFSPATVFRMPREDIVYDGVLLPKDTMIFFPLSIAGRDPTVVEDANRFDPNRHLPGEHRHVAFGRGVHICMGQFIARAQLEEGLHQIARRIGNPRRAGVVSWRPFPGNWGIESLPIAFEAQGDTPVN
jgi:cytochrome P450